MRHEESDCNPSTLGAIPASFERYVAAIGIEMRVEHARKTALMGTARILTLAFGC